MSDLKTLRSLGKRRLSLPTAKSFAAYLGTVADPEAALRSTLRAATLKTVTAAPTRGTAAEALAATGLTRSGYADYLRSAAKAEQTEATRSAYADYLKDRTAAVTGYGAYLDSLSKEMSTLQGRVLSYAKSNKLTDIGALTEHALSLGLPEDDAHRAATEASAIAKRHIRSAVVKSVISRDMNEAQARTYALAEGLDEADAIAIGKLARAMRDAVLDEIDLPAIFGDSTTP